MIPIEKPQLRHEVKHYINTADYLTLRSRLQHIAQIDGFAGSDGIYKVRSLYFDTPNNKALLAKINGVNRREKFRLRFYNDDPFFIRLEKKSKINRLCWKEKATISKEQCQEFWLGDDLPWLFSSAMLAAEFIPN